jgi:hypothetical protein
VLQTSFPKKILSQYHSVKLLAIKITTSYIFALIILPAQAIAADIAIKPWLLKGDEQKIDRLIIDGEIEAGDSKKLIFHAKENPKRFSAALLAGVVLNSNGGNVDEAIKISEILKETLATTMAFAPYKCQSACFYIFAGSAVRYATPNTIGVHRPYLPRNIMMDISPAAVERFTTEKYNELGKWLAKNSIPQDIVDKSFQRSSQEIYWLNNEDLIRVGTRAPWYEEWLIARCPEYPKAEKLFMQNPSIQNKNALEASAQCQHGIDQKYRDSAIEKMIKSYPHSDR